MSQFEFEYGLTELQEQALEKNVYLPVHKDSFILIYALLGNIVVLKGFLIYMTFRLGETSNLKLSKIIHHTINIEDLDKLSQIEWRYIYTVSRDNLEQWLK